LFVSFLLITHHLTNLLFHPFPTRRSSDLRQFGPGKEFEGACQQAVDALRQPIGVYDAILVDEAQDFPPSFLRLCYELLKSEKRRSESTRLNSSHDQISYAVFCLKKKKNVM